MIEDLGNDYENLALEVTQERGFDEDLVRTLGGEQGDTIELSRLSIRVARRPIAYNLSALYRKSHSEEPVLHKTRNHFDVWLLVMGFSIADEDNGSSVAKVGIKFKFPSEPRFTVLKQFPQTEFVKTEYGSISTVFNIDINGQVAVPELVAQLSEMLPISFGAKIALSNNANIVGCISFNTITPTIVTTGELDHEGQWTFTRKENPLLGDQALIMTMLVPRKRQSVEFEAQAFAHIRKLGGLYTARYESTWCKLLAELQDLQTLSAVNKTVPETLSETKDR